MLSFGKINENYLKKFINDWSIDRCSWMAISTNISQYRNHENNLQIEGLFKGQQNMLRWGQEYREQTIHLDLIKNNKVTKHGKVKNKEIQIFRNHIAGVLHLHLIRAREQMISWARNLEINGVHTAQSEERTLEWVKVSFIILKKAIKEAIEDQDSTLQMMLFSGQKDGKFHFKLRIYNLDIELQATDTIPQLIVYDKKNDESFLPTHQVLKGHLHRLLNPVIDEIIQLLPLLEALTKTKVITQGQ